MTDTPFSPSTFNVSWINIQELLREEKMSGELDEDDSEIGTLGSFNNFTMLVQSTPFVKYPSTQHLTTTASHEDDSIGSKDFKNEVKNSSGSFWHMTRKSFQTGSFDSSLVVAKKISRADSFKTRFSKGKRTKNTAETSILQYK